MCEKNVIYRNLKNAILKSKSSKNGKTKDPENSTKSERPHGRMAYDETNCPKSSIFKVFSKTKIIFRKNLKTCDLQGLLSQKYIICCVALLALRLVGDPRTHGPLAPTDHSTRTILGFWICIFLLFSENGTFLYFPHVVFHFLPFPNGQLVKSQNLLVFSLLFCVKRPFQIDGNKG